MGYTENNWVIIDLYICCQTKVSAASWPPETINMFEGFLPLVKN
jgi:hypothetical protein